MLKLISNAPPTRSVTIRLFPLFAVCAAFVGASSVHADDTSDREKARQHYQLAKTYFDMERFQEAAHEYLSAYELVPKPELLYNVAQAYRLDGNHEQSLLYYRRYIKLVPTGELAENARRYISNLIHEAPSKGHSSTGESSGDGNPTTIENGASPPSNESTTSQSVTTTTGEAGTSLQRTSATEKQSADPTKPPSPDGSSTTDKTQAGSSEVTTTLPVAPPDAGGPERPKGTRMRTIVSLATIGAGAVALGLGAKYGLDARGLSSDIEQTTMWTPESLAYFERGDAANTRAIVLLSVGAVAVAGGLTLYLTGRSSGSQETSTQVTVAPLLGPDGHVGIGMAGSL